MSERRSSLLLALLSLLVGACTLSPSAEQHGFYGEPVGSAASGAGAAPGATAPQSTPLVGWDGGVVQGPGAGQVSGQTLPGHGPEPTIEGRMHILELYQKVLDERDALAAEVKALTTALDKNDAGLTDARRSSSELETKLAAAEHAREELLKQNLELSGRLTTAQVRRLEAEKLLLETRIAWQKEKTAAKGPVVSQGEPKGGG